MALGLILLGMAQGATGAMSVGATVVRYEAAARPTVAVERGAVRLQIQVLAVVEYLIPLLPRLDVDGANSIVPLTAQFADHGAADESARTGDQDRRAMGPQPAHSSAGSDS